MLLGIANITVLTNANIIQKLSGEIWRHIHLLNALHISSNALFQPVCSKRHNNGGIHVWIGHHTMELSSNQKQ